MLKRNCAKIIRKDILYYILMLYAIYSAIIDWIIVFSCASLSRTKWDKRWYHYNNKTELNEMFCKKQKLRRNIIPINNSNFSGVESNEKFVVWNGHNILM